MSFLNMYFLGQTTRDHSYYLSKVPCYCCHVLKHWQVVVTAIRSAQTPDSVLDPTEESPTHNHTWQCALCYITALCLALQLYYTRSLQLVAVYSLGVQFGCCFVLQTVLQNQCQSNEPQRKLICEAFCLVYQDRFLLSSSRSN